MGDWAEQAERWRTGEGTGVRRHPNKPTEKTMESDLINATQKEAVAFENALIKVLQRNGEVNARALVQKAVDLLYEELSTGDYSPE